jgi:hypothetical protein
MMEKEREQMFLDLIRVNQMLLSGRPTEIMNAVYIHGLSEGMVRAADIFQIAKDLYAHSEIKVIAFNGSDGEGAGQIKKPREAWPGKKWYIEELRGAIMPEDLIPTGPGYHTRGETDELVKIAKKRKWKRVGILTVAYHYPRSFICLIQSMKTIGYWFEAYPIPPATTNWWLPMKGSQGKEDTCSFNETMKESIKVLDSYIAKGFGCTFQELFDYLRNRENIPLRNE